MGAYLILDSISKSYGDVQVLHSVSLTLAPGQRIGLVGANGVGKSTLFKIITGEIEADTGSVTIHAGAELGYLAQTMTGIDGKTINDIIEAALAELRAIEGRMRELEAHMADDYDRVAAEYGELADQFERRGGYDADHRVDVVLAGLRVDHLPRERVVTGLSGGEKSRLALAMLLLQSPDILLLDEPTNHLDVQSLEWLEGFLSTYSGSALIVSHDRQFLNRAVNVIVEIDEHTHEAERYTGDYDAFMAVKAKALERWIDDYWTQQDEIKMLRKAMKTTARQVAHNRPPTDGDMMQYNAKGANVERTISRNIRNVEERLRRIEADPVPRPPEPLRISPDFDPQELTGKIPLIASGISKRYGAREILRDVSFTLGAGERAVIVAPNGAGKSTLLRILAGVEQPDTGEVIRTGSAKIGYLDQEGDWLNLNQTVFEAYCEASGSSGETAKAELLRYGLFRYPDLAKRARDLSIGQRRKLQIAVLLAGRANLLLLDESTNHISFDVLEAFEAALREFRGAVLAISHDRRFIETFGGEVWRLEDLQHQRTLL